MLTTEKFYQIPEWDPERYERLGKLYDSHVALVCDLMFELTRAANWLCDQVRQNLSPSYRIAEGYLIVSHGPDETFGWSESSPRYSLARHVIRFSTRV